MRLFLAGLLVAIGLIPSAWSSPEDDLRLLGRSTVAGYDLVLGTEDRQWLRDKGTMKLGVSQESYPPLDVLTVSSDLEGITADYARLVSELLGVPVEVLAYSSRAEAVEALKRGEVDLLGSANDMDAQERGIVLSSSYVDDQPMLIVRAGEAHSIPEDLAGKRIAMAHYYLPETVVRSVYPKAELKLYPSTVMAVGALAFGQVDVYLGDMISSDHLINKTLFDNLRLMNFAQLESSGFSFAMLRQEKELVRVVNQALGAIPDSEREVIRQRWGGTSIGILDRDRPQLTWTEQRWIKQNPRVKVVVNPDIVPFTFFDENNVLQGISADVLDKISKRTGLQFEIVKAGSSRELLEKVKRGEADIAAAFLSDQSPQEGIVYTRPYVGTPFVMTTRVGVGAPETLDDMSGKRLSIASDNYVASHIRQNHPGVTIVEVGSASDALASLARGEVDAAVTTLLVARYMISREYSGQLNIASVVGRSAQVVFGVNGNTTDLLSIINKALLSFSPEEVIDLTNRWRGPVVFETSPWGRYGATAIQGIAIAGVLLILALVFIFYLWRSIKRREQAESALTDQLEFMRVLIDGTPNPIYVRDRQGNLLISNPSYLKVFGVEKEEVIGKPVTENMLVDPGEAQAWQEDYARVIADGKELLQDRHVRLANGEMRTIYHWMLPYRDRSGQVAGIIGGWLDITERQVLLDALQNAKMEAEDANRAKTTFLAAMSHEIRTPMNAVLGMLELASKKAEQGILDRLALDVAAESARGLLDLIGEILDIARIETGRLSITPERANLRRLVESVVRVFEGMARQKTLGLTLEWHCDIDRDVLIDPLRFKQILSNLVSNAIKYTSRGGVRMIVDGSLQEDQRLSLRISVVDTGQGISQEDQQRLFAPFSQASNNRQPSRNSSGLGLIISRTLCEMMGGELCLRSELNEGTQVEVLLDLQLLEKLPAPALAAENAPVDDAPSLNILIVDDYPANRLLLAEQLGFLGHRVTEAVDGVQGLTVWESGHFDVAVIDCNMPVMNGFELARAIREREQVEDRSRCLVIGYTATAQPEERQRCLEAGMDDCLFKPLTLDALKQRLANVEPRVCMLAEEAEEEDALGDELDLSNLERLSRGNADLIRRLLGDLAQSNREDLERLSTLMQGVDCQGLAELAHRVKGGARMARIRPLLEACERLEMVCKQGREEADIRQAGSALRDAMHWLDEAIERQLGKPAA
ncbi:transporter substrate-binding domain-containing protein [Zestomonas carbonaria]|uniref:histidine kinase n=1 Tax=Zestomonas carbonaria TaxID=2762745 RepID=A0A7U7IBX0_9GAMM|nr:transporter substrate-binding domain-containing protein [Pseudomonas carbonaria]CAD5110526.1 Virulence sensor protein BvgS [Pseudomonas carbonaria]